MRWGARAPRQHCGTPRSQHLHLRWARASAAETWRAARGGALLVPWSLCRSLGWQQARGTTASCGRAADPLDTPGYLGVHVLATPHVCEPRILSCTYAASAPGQGLLLPAPQYLTSPVYLQWFDTPKDLHYNTLFLPGRTDPPRRQF